MILIPATSFPITWSKQNLADSTTYYVKAVIRDVRTETILATILLTDLGNGRFSGTWNVPQDGSGFGRPVEIEKTVYEDSGYTQVSGIYGRWLDRYLIYNIAPRSPATTGGYGGHSAGIDYAKLKELIRETIKEEIEKPEPVEKVDLSPVLSSISVFTEVIEELQSRLLQVETKERNDTKVFDAAIADLKKVVIGVQKDLIGTKSDMKSVADKTLSTFSDMHAKATQSFSTTLEKKIAHDLDQAHQKIQQSVGESMDKFSAKIEDFMKKPLSVSFSNPKEEKPVNTREKTIKNILQYA